MGHISEVPCERWTVWRNLNDLNSMNPKSRIEWMTPLISFHLLAIFTLFAALAPNGDSQIYQFYWKDNAGNGNWEWGSSQWYSTQTNGNVGALNYNSGARLYFENTATPPPSSSTREVEPEAHRQAGSA